MNPEGSASISRSHSNPPVPAWRRPGLWIAVVLWVAMIGAFGWLQVRKFKDGLQRQSERQTARKKEIPVRQEAPLDLRGPRDENRAGPTPMQAVLLKSYLQDVRRSPEKLAVVRQLHSATGTQTAHALMCLHGLGGPRDLETALRELRRASMMGDSWAPAFLAAFLSRGDEVAGIPQDLSEARRLMALAAERKLEVAPALLARMDAGSDLWEMMMGSAPEALPTEREGWAPPAEAELPEQRSPIAVFQVRPDYPLPLRYLGIEGDVLVDFVVARDGSVTQAKCVKSTVPAFEPAASTAVGRWRFKPGVAEGRYVESHMQVPIVFTMNEDQVGTKSPATTPKPGR